MAQMYLIGDELTTTGFELAGVKKTYTATPENIKEVLQEVREDADIIAITNELYGHVEDIIKKIQSSGKIVIKIPDRSGGGEDIINRLIRDTIGFEIKSEKVTEADNKVVKGG
jgi:vacuolar-type H+-ATPase subunit F/Vma7